MKCYFVIITATGDHSSTVQESNVKHEVHPLTWEQ